MRASVLISSFFAVGIIAAPILDSTRRLPVDTSTVTDLVAEVEKTVGGAGLSSLSVRGVSVPDTSNLLNTDEVTKLVKTLEDTIGGGSDGASIIKKSPSGLLDLSSLLATVNGLLQDILDLVNTVKADIDTLVTDVENVDVEGVLSTVDDLLKQILRNLDNILSEQGLDLSLVTNLQPTLNTVTDELNDVVSEIESLTSNGTAGSTIDEVKSLLAQILAVIKGI